MSDQQSNSIELEKDLYLTGPPCNEIRCDEDFPCHECKKRVARIMKAIDVFHLPRKQVEAAIESGPKDEEPMSDDTLEAQGINVQREKDWIRCANQVNGEWRRHLRTVLGLDKKKGQS